MYHERALGTPFLYLITPQKKIPFSFFERQRGVVFGLLRFSFSCLSWLDRSLGVLQGDSKGANP